MQTKEINLGERKVIVEEISYLDAVFELNSLKDKPKEYHKKLITMSTGLTNEEVEKLNVKEGTKIINAINEVNGWSTDFQKTSNIEGTS